MTDRGKTSEDAGKSDGRRRRVRVNVGRDEIDDLAINGPAGIADERSRRSGSDETADPDPATVAGGDSRTKPDEAAGPGPGAAAEGVSGEVETLVAEACIEELARAEAQRDAYLEQLQRLKAEFDNYRKRLQREGEAQRLRASEGLVESLLPVLDNMERALEAAGKHEESKLIEGVELVSDQLRAVLASQGLEEVPAEPGVPFDPNVHEAVMAQESQEHPEGAITAVLEKGYLVHGRLLRPVRVIVAR